MTWWIAYKKSVNYLQWWFIAYRRKEISKSLEGSEKLCGRGNEKLKELMRISLFVRIRV